MQSGILLYSSRSPSSCWGKRSLLGWISESACVEEVMWPRSTVRGQNSLRGSSSQAQSRIVGKPMHFLYATLIQQKMTTQLIFIQISQILKLKMFLFHQVCDLALQIDLHVISVITGRLLYLQFVKHNDFVICSYQTSYFKIPGGLLPEM